MRAGLPASLVAIGAAVVFVSPAACGARTGLVGSAGDASTQADVAGADAVTFDATGCPQQGNPWLLFDVFDSTASQPGGLYAMRADGTQGHAVKMPHSPSLYPSVSPDGSQIIYATFEGGSAGEDGGIDSALYLYDIASHTDRLLLRGYQLNYSALSPDGQYIAYVSYFGMHSVRADGTGDRDLLDGPNGDGAGYGHPTFAPDSRTIIYGTGGAFGAIRVDGTGNETLVSGPAVLEYPNAAFSPDFTRLVSGILCDQTSLMGLRIYPYASLPAPCASGTFIAQTDISSAFNSANDPAWGPTNLIAYGSLSDVWVVDANGGTPRSMTAAMTDAGTMTASDPVWLPACADVP